MYICFNVLQRITAIKRCRLKRCNFQNINDMSKENKTSDKQEQGNDFITDVIDRFSDDIIDKLALEKYPERFCWYGSNPPKHIDDNARDRILWKKGFKDALNAL